MDDTSLEDFLDGDSEHSSADNEQPPEDTAETPPTDASDTEPSSTVEAATTTYQWMPSGKTCVSCGDQVTRLWYSEAGQVCPDCKEW